MIMKSRFIFIFMDFSLPLAALASGMLLKKSFEAKLR